MQAFRVCKRQFAETAFSGSGAAEYPGRWNSLGVKVVYCAQSRALAMLEILAHMHSSGDLARAPFAAVPIDVPDAILFKPRTLPKGWDEVPASKTSQLFADALLRKHVAILVPSVLVSGEFNLILNPEHADFPRIKIGPTETFSFDPRLTPPRRGTSK